MIPYYSTYTESVLASLPRPRPGEGKIKGRRVKVDVASVLELGQDGRRLMVVMQNSPSIFGLDWMEEGSVVLVVKGGEEERREMEGVLEEVVLEKWRKVFRVEVES